MIQYKAYSSSGSRSINEDRMGAVVEGDSCCFAVADGLGGHGNGEVAAQLAIDAVCGIFLKNGYTEDFFENAFEAAQEAILAEQERRHAPSGMKTTLVVLVIDGGMVRWAHIGDSRLYIFKRNKVKTRTLDHSVPQMLVKSGEIKERDIRNHPDRNRLMRVLGIKGEKPKLEIGPQMNLAGCQAFLLCSDGYWELIEEKKMGQLLKSSSTSEEWIEKMNESVHSNGKDIEMDNYTAIAVFCDKGRWFW